MTKIIEGKYIIESCKGRTVRHLFDIKEERMVKDKETGEMKLKIKPYGFGYTFASAMSILIKLKVFDSTDETTIEGYLKEHKKEQDDLFKRLKL